MERKEKTVVKTYEVTFAEVWTRHHNFTIDASSPDRAEEKAVKLAAESPTNSLEQLQYSESEVIFLKEKEG
jgi:hypothetical protein